MFAFTSVLIPAAVAAGIKVPDSSTDLDNLETLDKTTYPHWFVYAMVQTGASMPYPGVHFDNAKVIANIPLDKIKTVTLDDLCEMGFSIGHST